ncbi:MAG: hypothetical protein AAFR44_01750, partial [Pseudomonadota bacterium]
MHEGIDYTAIRERIALVVETFSRSTVAFPDPMPADEAATALGWSDAELDDFGVIVPLAHKWGVCLDWLIVGDVKALIGDGRRLRERERSERQAIKSDPAVIAYNEWREIERYGRSAIDAEANARPNDPQYKELAAAAHAATDAEIRACMSVAEAQASTLDAVRLQLIAWADAEWGLKAEGNPERITDYAAYESWYR